MYVRPFPVVRKCTYFKRTIKETTECTDNSLASSRNLRLFIPSGPGALLRGSDFKTVSTSSRVICIEVRSTHYNFQTHVAQHLVIE